MLTFLSYLLSSFGHRSFFILFLLSGFLKAPSYGTWNFLVWPKENVFARGLYAWC
jgi:hypothetical protein